MKKLVLQPEQYNKGYICNPHINIGQTKILYEIQPYKFLERLSNGNYIVQDPNDD